MQWQTHLPPQQQGGNTWNFNTDKRVIGSKTVMKLQAALIPEIPTLVINHLNL
jgi:hypothetical protein